MAKLTTHVLDIYSGKPGKGIKVDLFYISGDKKTKLNTLNIKSVNKEQIQAVNQLLNNTVSVITGPPGTGKSETIVSAVASVLLQSGSVLFASMCFSGVGLTPAPSTPPSS